MTDQDTEYQSLDYITRTGEEFYMEKLREKLEKTHKGEYVVIEPESKSYFVDADLLEAIQKAEEKFPDSLFYIVRIGSLYPTSAHFRKPTHAWKL
jgi:hypothetical protein